MALTITGKPTTDINPGFLQAILAAARNAGATNLNIISGYRSPSYNASVGGAQDSNHTRGLAMDATVTIPGRGTIPLGDLPGLSGYGLRSGDQAGFFHGKPDPEHVDAGYEATSYSPPGNERQLASASSYSASMFTPGQAQFINRYAQVTGLDPRVVAAEVYNEMNGSAAAQRQAAGNHDWLNIGYTDSGPMGTGYAAWRNPITAADASAAWIKGQLSIPGFGKASSGIQGILRTIGQSPAQQIAAIQGSGWASSGYPNLPSIYRSVTGGGAGYNQPSNWGNAAGAGAGGQTINYRPNWITFPQTNQAGFGQAINQIMRTRTLANAATQLPSKLAPITTAAPNISGANLTPAGDYGFQNLIKGTSF